MSMIGNYERWRERLRELFDQRGGAWIGYVEWMDEVTLKEAFINEITPYEMYRAEMREEKDVV